MSSSTGINPFPGIRPFDIQEKYLFFGREDQTAELLTRLRKTRFLAVVGSSGSGKSSLVRAGLIPELHGGTMAAAGSSWEVAVMKPGGDPLTNLAKSLVESDLYDPDQEDVLPMIRAALSRSGMGLVDAVQQSDLEPKTNLLLVVDQFEEIFRFRRMTGISEEEAGHFIRLLLEASQQESCPIYVVLTMRSDFLGDCAQFGGLAEAVNEGEYIIPRLNRSQRKQAIEAPARVGGREMSNRLVQRLLNDISDDPDQLPILQHALMRTWDYWVKAGSEGPVDLEHYQATGGMAEALSRHADEVFESLPNEEHRRIATKLFKSLTEKVSENRGIRRPMQLNELHEICGGDMNHLLHVINEFRKTGCTFLMPAGENELQKHTIIDISHESLMRVWRTLRIWVDDEAQSAKIYRRLADTASLFKDGKAGLYRDPDLGIALAWRDANLPNQTWADRYYAGFAEAMAFLDKSQAEEEREAKEKEEARKRELAQAQALAKAKARTARIFKAACVGVTILAVACLYAFVEAQRNKSIAELAVNQQADLLIESGNYLRAQKNHQGAALYYANAYNLYINNAAEKQKAIKNFASSFIKSPQLRLARKAPKNTLIWNLNGDGLTVLSTEGITTINSSNTITHPFDFTKCEKFTFSNSAKGAYYIKNNNLFMFNTISGETIKLKTNHEIIKKADLQATHSDQKTLLLNGKKISALLLNESNGEEILPEWENFTISNDKSHIGKLDEDGSLLVYDIDQNATTSYGLNSTRQDTIHLQDFLINKNSGKIYVLLKNKLTNSHILEKYDTKTGQRTFTNAIGSANLIQRKFQEDGSIFLSLDSFGAVTIVNLVNGETTSPQTPSGSISKFALSKDGIFTALINDKGNLSLYNNYSKTFRFVNFRLPSNPSDLRFSEDGMRLRLYAAEIESYYELNLPVYAEDQDAYFPSRFYPIKLDIRNGDKPIEEFSHYTLELDQTRSQKHNNNASGVQLAEIRFYNAGEAQHQIKPYNYSVEGNIPKGEELINAFDDNFFTKYFNFQSKVNPIELFFEQPQAITFIEFVSANDLPGRDPIFYTLYGRRNNQKIKLSEGDIISEGYRNQLDEISRLFANADKKEFIQLYRNKLLAEISNAGITPIAPPSINEHDGGSKKLTNNQKEENKYHWHTFNYEILKNNQALVAADRHLDWLERNQTQSSITEHKKGIHSILTNDPDKAVKILRNQIDASLECKFDYVCSLIKNKEYNLAGKIISEHVTSTEFGNNSYIDTQFLQHAVFTRAKLSSKAQSTINDLISKENITKIDQSPGSYLVDPITSLFAPERAFTIEFWIKPNTNTSGGFILNKGGDGPTGSDGFSIFQPSSNMIRFEAKNSNYNLRKQYDVELQEGAWSHYAATWGENTKTIKFFINTKLQGSYPLSQNPIGLNTSSYTFGCLSDPKSALILPWNGSLSEFRIWSLELPAPIIAENYKKRLEVPSFGLHAVWDFGNINGHFNPNHTTNNISYSNQNGPPISNNALYTVFNYMSNDTSAFGYTPDLMRLAFSLKTLGEKELEDNYMTLIGLASDTQNIYQFLLKALVAFKIGKKEEFNSFYDSALALLGQPLKVRSAPSHIWRHQVIRDELLLQIADQINKEL